MIRLFLPRSWMTASCLLATVYFAVLLGLTGCNRVHRKARPTASVADGHESEPVADALASEATAEQVKQLCGACHAVPPPDSYPRAAWPAVVKQGYDFYLRPTRNNPSSLRGIKAASREQILAYYEHRAPEALRVLDNKDTTAPMPIQFHKQFVPLTADDPWQAVSNVNLVHLSDPHKLDLLACDMRRGRLMAMKPYEAKPQWRTVARLANPAHTEVVDLDGDGIKDILVADLGNFTPTDNLCGRVIWLRGKPDGTYAPFTLLDNVGRVADVRAADFFGHGKTDLIVAVFGWRYPGSIVLLENQTTDWNHPRFVPHILDGRPGTIHVPVCDLNGDGKPDFVALISQEFETVVAFINEGNGHFHRETIYQAPHPAYGSTGIQLVDLDGDGKLDVLYTNGDVFDDYILKPYHGINWLRNRGTYPFEDHLLTSMYGVHRAVAADFQGKGRKDIVAVSLLPARAFPKRKELGYDGVVYLEQVAPGKFVRHSLAKGSCDHVSCAAGAWKGDGKVHLVTGNFRLYAEDPVPNGVTLWNNLGPAPPKQTAQRGRD